MKHRAQTFNFRSIFPSPFRFNLFLTCILFLVLFYSSTTNFHLLKDVHVGIRDGENCKILNNEMEEAVQNGWSDTTQSVASQGKLWHPQKHRKFPNANRLFLKTESFKPFYRRTSGPICNQWAVVTTIFPPTKVIFQIANLSNWCLIVVGDRKSNNTIWNTYSHLKSKSVVYISADDQQNLPYQSVRSIPWNHFGRKNVGYLFAIHHGAQVIWDTDDDNELLNPDLLNKLVSQSRNSSHSISEISNSHQLWNPYPVFDNANGTKGAYNINNQTIWPRGFPLPLIKDSETVKFAPLKNTTNVSVFQSLADNDPDVDAIYRLSQPLPVFFSKSRVEDEIRKLALPKGRVAPFNAQATLWKIHSFWGLLLPISVHGRVSDIWRSYITQRLFQIVGQRLAFTSPIVAQFRNVHSYIADLHSEIPLYTHTNELLKWMSKWTPPERSSFIAIFEDFYVCLYEIGVFEVEDIELIQRWISDLDAIGYRFPKSAIK